MSCEGERTIIDRDVLRAFLEHHNLRFINFSILPVPPATEQVELIRDIDKELEEPLISLIILRNNLQTLEHKLDPTLKNFLELTKSMMNFFLTAASPTIKNLPSVQDVDIFIQSSNGYRTIGYQKK